MDEKLSQPITYLSESQIKEIYGDFIEDWCSRLTRRTHIPEPSVQF